MTNYHILYQLPVNQNQKLDIIPVLIYFTLSFWGQKDKDQCHWVTKYQTFFAPPSPRTHALHM